MTHYQFANRVGWFLSFGFVVSVIGIIWHAEYRIEWIWTTLLFMLMGYINGEYEDHLLEDDASQEKGKF